MCITLISTHSSCAHQHFLGTYNCSLNCPIDQRHTFHLTDTETYDCQTCVSLYAKTLDPDITPVTYCAPVFDVDGLAEDVREEKKAREGKGEAWSEKKKGKKAERKTGKEESARHYKSLSDTSSTTSQWRHKHKSISTSSTSTHTTPRTAAHRNLVKKQLQDLKPLHNNPAAGVVQDLNVAPTDAMPSWTGGEGYRWNGMPVGYERGRYRGRGGRGEEGGRRRGVEKE